MIKNIIVFFLAIGFVSCSSSHGKKESHNKVKSTETTTTEQTTTDSIVITPIKHASFIMQINHKVIAVDPIGEPSLYQEEPTPDMVLITHDHPDHLSPETLASLVSKKTPIVAPQAVKNALPEPLKKQTQVMKNGDHKTIMRIDIKAIPAYNLRPQAQKFHPKGRGNGYIVSAKGKRVYISGDTEDIPAMLKLKNIDIAFICMNLPYTMTVEQAVKAVTTFRPKMVYPYHYRNKDGGYSDIQKFKREVEHKDPGIRVRLRQWYPNRK